VAQLAAAGLAKKAIAARLRLSPRTVSPHLPPPTSVGGVATTFGLSSTQEVE
jgi:regulatory LuxR family protein